MLGPAGRVAVVGARGAVGRELAALLAARGVTDVRRLGRRRADDQERLTAARLRDRDVVFFCAPAGVARRWAPRAVAAGALVVDNSSAFRLDPAVPLVIPEINPEALAGARLLANPNCSTILLLLAVAPLHRAFGCERVAVTTYQAVSGAGAAALRELDAATAAALAGAPFTPSVFHEPAAFNCFSHDSVVDPQSGANGEERKIELEGRRILGAGPLFTATCVRVPVRRAHCEAVDLRLATPVTVAQARRVLAAAAGVVVVDDRRRNRFPSSLAAEGRDEVLVGRLRLDRSRPWTGSGARARGVGLHLFLAGDQLRKGAARNALQIADAALAAVPYRIAPDPGRRRCADP